MAMIYLKLNMKCFKLYTFESSTAIQARLDLFGVYTWRRKYMAFMKGLFCFQTNLFFWNMLLYIYTLLKHAPIDGLCHLGRYIA